MLAKANRKAVYRFSQVPPDVAEAKTRAILRILGEALKAQRQQVAVDEQHGRMSALNQIEEVAACRER